MSANPSGSRKPRDRNRREQRAAREFAREAGLSYQQALLRLRAERAAAPEVMAEGLTYPYVEGLRRQGIESDEQLTIAVAKHFDVTRQTARWWLVELDLVDAR